MFALRLLAIVSLAFCFDAQRASAVCIGDCNTSDDVTVDELITGVNIALGTLALDQCEAFESNTDRAVTVDELIAAVNNALAGCLPEPTPTPTPVRTTPTQSTETPLVPTPTGLPTASLTPTSGPPPDPADVAPPTDASVPTNVGPATDFLYDPPPGVDPIQTGVARDTIEPVRAAVVRGKVLDRAGAALSEVTITIVDYPELGQTLSRTDGMFDMAVNGGGPLTVSYVKSGFYPARRKINVPQQDYTLLPDVVLIPLDSRATAIDLNSGAMQVAEGNPVTDAAGTRQATLLFPAGTTAEMVFADGSTEPISTLNVRLTEFTVGENGPRAMPAELPPESAYTYALVFTADQALAEGAEDVYFSAPLPFYVENFLNFPVGIEAPLGSFSRKTNAWVASDSGRVIGIVGESGGSAEVDSDGDGLADDLLGLSTAERQQLAALYEPGATLWRLLIPHFDEPWDVNWSFGPPDDAVPPNQPRPNEETNITKPCRFTGSVIECQNQTLREMAPIVGTPYTLSYASDRVVGRNAAVELKIPLSGNSLPASLRSIGLTVSVAGRELTSTYPPAINQIATVVWDQQDAYGRTLQGAQTASVKIRYVYPGVYQRTDRFGYRGKGLVIEGSRTREDISFVQEHRLRVGGFDANGQGLGGWDFDVHQVYDPLGRTMYAGNGERRTEVETLGATIDTFSGVGEFREDGDGGPATGAAHLDPRGIAVGPDGSVYILTNAPRIRRVAPDGTISTVATYNPGCYAPCPTAGGLHLQEVNSIAAGGDGRIYIGDRAFHTVRRLDPDNVWRLVAGTPFTPGFSGDGGPAVNALLNSVVGLAVGRDGSVYIADRENKRIRQVSPDGFIFTIAGNGADDCTMGGYDPCGLDGPATAVGLGTGLGGIAVAPDGGVTFGWTGGRNSWRILQVTTAGQLIKIAGGGGGDKAGEGVMPFDEALAPPFRDLAYGPDGSLYFGNGFPFNRVRQLQGGAVFTAAGDLTRSQPLDGGDGGPAAAANVTIINALATGPAGELYIGGIYRTRRVGTRFPGFNGAEHLIPSADGSMLYRFDVDGRHVATLHSLTGQELLSFGYDQAGMLASITERTGGTDNVTTIEHDGAGNPTAIVAPFGQRTTLGVDANGWLNRVTNPADETTAFGYTADGLMMGMTTPRNHSHVYGYDSKGRLMSDADPAGGSATLSRTELAATSEVRSGHEVALETGLGRTSRYRVEHLQNGQRREVNTTAAGIITPTLFGGEGTETTTQPSGGILGSLEGPDSRFGMLAPLQKSVNWKMPSGLTLVGGEMETAELSNPNDLLSVTSITGTVMLNGRNFLRSYDAATRTFTDTTAAGRNSTLSIDSLGRPLTDAIGGLADITYEYDTRGRLARTMSGGGEQARVTTVTYDQQSYPDTVTDALNRVTSYDYDTAGRITAMTYPDGRVVRYAYDADGNVISVAPPGRPAHTFDYTPVDLESLYTPPDIGLPEERRQMSYDVDRKPTQIVLADGRAIMTSYDDGGRVQSVGFSRGAVGYTYNSAGQIESITAPGGIVDTLAYDGILLRSDARSGPVAGTVSWTYDSDFRIASQSINGAQMVNFGYDADSLLTQVGALTHTYNQVNALLTGAAIGGIQETWTYDLFGEPTQYTVRFGATTLYSLALTYDAIGRISRKVENIEGTSTTYEYTYDLAGRLTGVMTNGAPSASYTYDQNSNRLTRTAGATTETSTFDAQDRLLGTQQTGPAGQRSFTYNAHGQLQSATVNGQITTYTYDEMDNLVGVEHPGGSDTQYLIDGLNRRVGKSIDGTVMQGLLYDNQLRVTAELDGAGQVVSRFVLGRSFQPDYFTRDGNTYRIIADQLGSPRLVVDVDDGTVMQRIRHDEFGRVIEDTNPGFTPFGFAGGLYDEDSGLVRFGTRDYDPRAGRWTSKDPIGFAAGDPNLYLYASADPINNIDPDGRESCGCEPPVAEIVEVKGTGPSVGPSTPPNVSIRRKGSNQLVRATVGMPLYIGDEIVTDSSSTAGIEFTIGGRVGVAPRSASRITGERSACGLGAPKVNLEKGGIWAKVDKLKEPLEVQTGGGIMGMGSDRLYDRTWPYKR